MRFIIQLFIITGFFIYSNILLSVNAMALDSSTSSLSANAMMLERDNIMYYKQEIISQNPLILKISGLCGSSALSVKRIYTKSEGKTLTIYIKLILAPGDHDYSGSFEYLLQIPDDIDTIQLGEKKVVIWERASGPATTKYKVDGPPPWLIEKNKTQTP